MSEPREAPWWFWGECKHVREIQPIFSRVLHTRESPQLPYIWDDSMPTASSQLWVAHQISGQTIRFLEVFSHVHLDYRKEKFEGILIHWLIVLRCNEGSYTELVIFCDTLRMNAGRTGHSYDQGSLLRRCEHQIICPQATTKIDIRWM